MPPAIAHQQPGHQYAFKDQSGSGAEVEKPRGQSAISPCKEQADDLHPARKINRLSYAEKNAKPDQDFETPRQASEPLGQ